MSVILSVYEATPKRFTGPFLPVDEEQAGLWRANLSGPWAGHTVS